MALSPVRTSVLAGFFFVLLVCGPRSPRQAQRLKPIRLPALTVVARAVQKLYHLTNKNATGTNDNATVSGESPVASEDRQVLKSVRSE